MKEKRCTQCGKVKPLTEFYRQASSKDGHKQECKLCSLARVREYGKTDKAREAKRRYRQSRQGQQTEREYRQSQARKDAVYRYRSSARGKKQMRQRCLHVRRNNSLAYKAHYSIHNAICRGQFPSPKALGCLCCDKDAQVYHHHMGYAQEHWFDVLPLCRLCHSAIHRRAYATAEAEGRAP